MKILKGLYFPGTNPGDEFCATLSCLFDGIDSYRIVEDNDRDEVPYRRGRVILPLGGDRDRFLAMVRDIKNHAAEYYRGYLSSLPTGTGFDRDESSVRGLIANLQGEKKGENQADTEKIWQARLVLQLAEILAEEMCEVDRGLAALSRSEQAVFKALRGESDYPDDDPIINTGGDLSSPVHSGPGVSKLLKAWAVIFGHDSEDYPVLVTDSEAAASLLFEIRDDLAEVEIQASFELELPIPDGNDAIEVCRTGLSGARAAVIATLEDIVAGRTAVGSAPLERALGLWRSEVEPMAGRKLTLVLNVLPENLFNRIWQRLGGAAADDASDGQRHRLVGLLKATR